MAKTLDFKDFLNVDYAPGMDPIIKKAAKKRKSDETMTSGPSEAVAPGGKAPKPLSGKAAQAYIDGGKHAANITMGREGKHSIVKDPASKKHVHVYTYESVEDLDEALTPQQRRQRAMSFRRIKAKVELGRERASRRFADLPRLKNRARKEARTMIFKKLTKGIPKDEMTYQRRQDFENRMNTPGMKKRIDVLAAKLLKNVRAAEIKRHQTSGQKTQND
jgi:hypothetical protein